MTSKKSTEISTATDEALREQAARLGARLKSGGLLVATAESCTGGWIAKTFTDLAGSSDWFNGGVVTYSDAAKEHMLGVERAVLEAHGAVSEPVVRQMAQGALAAVGAHCAVSVSGIAGPGGGTADKPVGTVWFAAAVRRGQAPMPARTSENLFEAPGARVVSSGEVRVQACVHRFGGSRDDVRRASVAAAIELLTQVLDSD